ncbi:DUF4349 domain-containing protein [Chitinophaga sp. RAB17]|uniref:DUF4349 domain-containing protein n=1 Tax=Chitinophaga sp. RAB17 TaxID=3233049 RepID=UPI003F900B92
MKHSIFLILSTAILLLSACSSNNSSLAKQLVAPAPGATLPEERIAAIGVTSGSAEKDEMSPAALDDRDNSDPLPISQKIIKNGILRFSTSDFDACRNRVADTVKKYGGYIANESQTNTSMEWRNELEIKVPSATFDKCMEALAGGATRVDEKSMTSTDVTAEYVDLDARMKARMAVEQRYLQILQQAKKVEEILAVEAQLKSIREEIESAKGRLQYMDHHVAYSGIHLTYYQTFANTEPQAPGFFKRSWLSFAEGWNSFLSFSLGLLSAWPLLLGIVFIFIFIRRGIRKWKLKRAIAPTPTNVNL